MNESEIQAIAQLTEIGISAGIRVYTELRNKNPKLPPVWEMLASANKKADDIIAKADAEIAATDGADQKK